MSIGKAHVEACKATPHIGGVHTGMGAQGYTVFDILGHKAIFLRLIAPVGVIMTPGETARK